LATQEWMLIYPKMGQPEHRPDPNEPAWSFKYDGQVHLIQNADGSPNPLPVDLGHFALNYFTRNDGKGRVDSLVDYDIQQGELTLTLKQQAYACPLCHEKFDGLVQMTDHVPGCAAAMQSAQPPPPATRPKAKPKTDDAELA
jgi:hypothetical protein